MADAEHAVANGGGSRRVEQSCFEWMLAGELKCTDWVAPRPIICGYEIVLVEETEVVLVLPEQRAQSMHSPTE